jgi:putative transposase
MTRPASLYKRHRFPPQITQPAVWTFQRCNQSSGDVENLLAERGIAVSYKSIRLWCIKFGAKYAKRLKGRHRGYGDTFFIDEVFVRIRGKQHYLWRGSTRTVKWSMYFCRGEETAGPQGVFSSGC